MWAGGTPRTLYVVRGYAFSCAGQIWDLICKFFGGHAFSESLLGGKCAGRCTESAAGRPGERAKPNVGRHKLYSFLTTAPTGIIEPIHNKAMPVLLLTPADVERWLESTAEEALELQKPSPDDAIIMDPSLEKKTA